LTVVQTDTARQVRIVATNGTDESIAVVLDREQGREEEQNQGQETYYEKHKPAMLEYSHNYYARNRQMILAKKKIYNAKEENKQRSAERHRHYYQSHKEELRRQQRQYRNNKNRKTTNETTFTYSQPVNTDG